MNYTDKKLLSALFMLLILCGCSSKSENKDDSKHSLVLGKIELAHGWARPGAQGQSSAAYLTITNGTASTDTLLEASSDVSQKAEVHESYKDDSGNMGMRPAGQLVIDSGNRLIIKPGGLHIMLMNLKKDIAVGDSLELSLTFEHAGEKTVRIPVEIQN